MKKSKFTEVCILDICLSDYFSGYHLPVLAIPVYHGMTNKDIADEIKNEINSCYDYLCESFKDADLNLFDMYIDKLMLNPDKENFLDLEIQDEEEDFGESVYMYLSLCKPVTRYGMTFLNE